MALNPNTIVGQMRLNTGDYIEDEPYLEDAVYVWLYEQNGNSVIEGSIAALESIINNIALSPASWRIDNVSESTQSIESLERRLTTLKLKRTTVKAPVVFSSDRKDWCDFDKAFK